jgi:uncharacterized protein involved in outer membrane biogenesis
MATPSSSVTKSSRFPLWGKILLSVLVLLLLIVVAVPYFVNVDRYRDTIADAIAKQTGRKVTLGPIHARLFPGAGVTVADLHIGNPSGFPAGDLLSADEIGVNVALAPLLHGTIHVNSVDIVRPKMTILTDSAGKNNYTFASPDSTEASAAAAKSGETSSSMTLDQIDSIKLTGAEIVLGSVIKGAAAPLADTKGISITLHNFAVNPMRMHDWQAESNLSSVTLALSGWKDPITFHNGQFTLSGGKLDAQFVADLATAADIKGTVNVPDFEHPQVNFEMSSSQLDVDKLLDVAGSGPGIPSSPAAHDAGTPAPAQGPAKAKPAAASAPKAAPASAPAPRSELIARGHINIEKITTKPYAVGPANIEIRVYTDRAELWPISIGMYGGTLQISSRVDRMTDPARFTANVQMRNLDVAKVLDASPSARGKMGGTGELDLQLLGSLSEVWKKTLTGTGKFAVHNGHLPGVNLAGAAESVVKMAGVGGDTPFSVLEGDLTIADQRVSSKQIHLDSSVGVVDLRGSVGLDGTLDYQGSTIVNPAGALGSGAVGGIVGGLIGSRVGKITVPFALAGTIESPKVSPGKGIPSFGAPSTASGATPSAAPSGQPPALQDDVNTLKNLFKKKN